MSDELKTIKFQMMLSPSDAENIDSWGFARRIRSRAEAIRRLAYIGQAFSGNAEALLKRNARALKALQLALDKTTAKAEIDNLPKRFRSAYIVAIEEQVEALNLTVETLVTAELISSAAVGEDVIETLKWAKSFLAEVRSK